MNPSNFIIFVASELLGAKSKSLIYIYIYREREREREREKHDKILGFSLKIFTRDFFFMDGSLFFKLSSHMTES